MKVLAVLLLFIVVSFSTLACNVGGNHSSPDGEMSGKKKAPNFSLRSVDGKTVKLSDFKNKIVILDFWATWCPPCRKGIPDLIAIQKEYKNDVVVIGVSVDAEQTRGDVPGFVKQYGINYPVLYADDKIADAYGGIEGIPTAFIIDKKGNIVDSHVGLVPKSMYTDAVKKLLAK